MSGMVTTRNHSKTSNITTKASSPKKFGRPKTKVLNSILSGKSSSNTQHTILQNVPYAYACDH